MISIIIIIRFVVRLDLFVFNVFKNLSAITDVRSLSVEYIKKSCFSNNYAYAYCKIFFLDQPNNLFGARLDSFTISINTLKTVLSLSSFKGLKHLYLVKTPLAHNKYLTFLFFEDKDPISAWYVVFLLLSFFNYWFM